MSKGSGGGGASGGLSGGIGSLANRIANSSVENGFLIKDGKVIASGTGDDISVAMNTSGVKADISLHNHTVDLPPGYSDVHFARDNRIDTNYVVTSKHIYKYTAPKGGWGMYSPHQSRTAEVIRGFVSSVRSSGKFTSDSEIAHQAFGQFAKQYGIGYSRTSR